MSDMTHIIDHQRKEAFSTKLHEVALELMKMEVQRNGMPSLQMARSLTTLGHKLVTLGALEYEALAEIGLGDPQERKYPLCPKGLHEMTPENSRPTKGGKGHTYMRCHACSHNRYQARLQEWRDLAVANGYDTDRVAKMQFTELSKLAAEIKETTPVPNGQGS